MVESLRNQGVNVIEGDATDREFWERIRGNHTLEIAIFALPNREANAAAIRLLRRTPFSGTIGVITREDDEAAVWTDFGVDASLSLYAGAGAQLAEQALQHRLP